MPDTHWQSCVKASRSASCAAGASAAPHARCPSGGAGASGPSEPSDSTKASICCWLTPGQKRAEKRASRAAAANLTPGPAGSQAVWPRACAAQEDGVRERVLLASQRSLCSSQQAPRTAVCSMSRASLLVIQATASAETARPRPRFQQLRHLLGTRLERA